MSRREKSRLENYCIKENLYRDLIKIEQYEMFLFGGREMYNYFKSVRIIDYLQKSKRCDKIYKINERIM